MPSIKCVVACTNSEGTPDFFFCEISVSPSDYDDGLHYQAARLRAADEGYEYPMIAFDENDGPNWLFDKFKSSVKVVWVATVEHKHGTNTYVGATEDDVYEEVFDYVEGEWPSEIPDIPMPEDHRQAVDDYFAEESVDECLEIETSTVRGS